MGKVLLLLVGVIGGLVLIGDTVSAAPPSLEVTQGVVASSQTATFSPTTRGPVTFSGSGACPRWSGTINTTNLGVQPINSNIATSNLDAGDVVTFAVAIRNTSVDGNAFDVTLNNPLPDGFELPGTGAEGANLCVTRGGNTAAAYTSNGAGFFGTTENDNIELNDTGSGSIAPTHPTNGQDVIILTYDLVVAPDHVPNSTRTSTATLLYYSESEGGSLIEGSDESATVKMGSFGRTKSLIATSESFTSGSLVVVGEELTYRLTIQVPQGEIDTVSVVDTMTPGLVFAACDSIVNDDSASLSTNLAGGISSACDDPANPTVASDGRIVTFNLGDLVNTDRDDAQAETITITYRVIVANHSAAINNAALNNSAIVQWEGNNSAASESAAVTVREAWLQATANVAPTTAKPGDRVTVTLNVAHQSGSNVPAFDAVMSNAVPAGLTPDLSTLECGGGSLAPTSCGFSGTTLRATWTTFAVGQTSTIEYEAVVDQNASGTGLSLPFAASWTSLAGDVLVSQSPYSSLAVERTGDVTDLGGVSNAYRSSIQAQLALASTTTGGSQTGDQQNEDAESLAGRLADTGMDSLVPLGVIGGLLIVAAVCGWMGVRLLHRA